MDKFTNVEKIQAVIRYQSGAEVIFKNGNKYFILF
ncbi:hypothetical protein A21D_01248 [Virgibacillus dokdonensis]|uniref:Uncharacterized protein n=1 Tax=Virgibacillus dokdonensis TaxID=302167 RepID=A0A2K9IXC0_9BACI|nr:hypothetical protein A21D_01248 [Virgibacillus dokdonensis]